MLDFLHTVQMVQIKRTSTAPLILELRGTLESSELSALSDQIHAASTDPSTCIVDFTDFSFSDALWPSLQRELIRWVSRAGADLWYTGLRLRPEWNHCSTRGEILTLLASPELAWNQLAQWIETRKTEIDSKIESFTLSSSEDSLKTLRPLYLERKRKRIESILIEKLKKRPAPQDTSSAIPLSLSRLEEKILTALHSGASST